MLTPSKLCSGGHLPGKNILLSTWLASPSQHALRDREDQLALVEPGDPK